MEGSKSWWRQPVRVWIIRMAVFLVVVEVGYVVAANALLRTGTLERLLNKKPEKTRYSWQSASTLLPGVVRVEGRCHVHTSTLVGRCHVHTSTLVVMRSVDTRADSVMGPFNRGLRVDRDDPALENLLAWIDAANARRS